MSLAPKAGPSPLSERMHRLSSSMAPLQVDHLHLKKNRRRTHKRLGGVGGETWESMEVNP